MATLMLQHVGNGCWAPTVGDENFVTNCFGSNFETFDR